MTPNDLLRKEHETIREGTTALTQALDGATAKVQDRLTQIQKILQTHFRREEIYYRTMDDGKRIEDRGAMHTLRNDHAAILFSLESLMIRLRKDGVTDDWRRRLKAMTDVLLPHLTMEENFLFPKTDTMLSPEQKKTLLEEMKNRE